MGLCRPRCKSSCRSSAAFSSQLGSALKTESLPPGPVCPPRDLSSPIIFQYLFIILCKTFNNLHSHLQSDFCGAFAFCTKLCRFKVVQKCEYPLPSAVHQCLPRTSLCCFWRLTCACGRPPLPPFPPLEEPFHPKSLRSTAMTQTRQPPAFMYSILVFSPLCMFSKTLNPLSNFSLGNIYRCYWHVFSCHGCF